MFPKLAQKETGITLDLKVVSKQPQMSPIFGLLLYEIFSQRPLKIPNLVTLLEVHL